MRAGWKSGELDGTKKSGVDGCGITAIMKVERRHTQFAHVNLLIPRVARFGLRCREELGNGCCGL